MHACAAFFWAPLSHPVGHGMGTGRPWSCPVIQGSKAVKQKAELGGDS